MTVSFGRSEEAFRAEVRAFLQDQAPARDPNQYFRGRGGATRELYRALGSRDWLVLTWPKEVGGAGLGAAHEFILWDELAYARAARPDLGPGIVAKTLIRHGTADQQHRYLPGIRSGNLGFALGYSEPEAGSDLGAVRTRARRDGETYRVSGEKRWTSDAHNSDFLWLLCRSQDEAGADLGRTLLILDLHAEGVSVNPIETIDGHRLNEVVLDDVVVPTRDRVGADGAAWMLIREALAVERHLMVMPGRVRRDLEVLLEWAGSSGAITDPALEQRVRDLVVDVAEVRAASWQTLALTIAGQDCTASAARLKLFGSETCQAIARCAFECGYLPDGDLDLLWRESVMETVAGGTSEVMQGVLARAQYGMGVVS